MRPRPTIRRLTLTLALALVGSIYALTALCAWAVLVAEPPDPKTAQASFVARRLVDRHGQLLRVDPPKRRGRTGRYRALSEISPWIVLATVAAEDRRFFAHPGVDAAALLRALWQNARAGTIRSGASTLTMQLVRQLRRRPRSLSGKLGELKDALALERRLGKHALLEHYLNMVPYGNGAVGVDAAARLYFGVSAAQVDLGQAALLAGLPRGPSRYDPYKRPEAAHRLRDRVLAALSEAGLLDRARTREAADQPLALTARRRPPFLAPHFTQWVERRLAARPELAGVRHVRTSLDAPLQRELERLVSAHLARFGKDAPRNAAAIVVENDSGDVLAYVGSQGYSAAAAGAVDGVQSRRQPGSTLKPFIYALAIEDGASAATLVADLPLVFSPSSKRDGIYRPRNYDGRFHGPLRLRQALASSRNIPAVRMVKKVGLDRTLRRLRALGLGLSKRSTHYGVSIALGGGEVRLLDLTRAYATLARGGVDLPPRPILGTRSLLATGSKPRETRWPAATPRRIVTAGAAHLITDILADPLARIRGFGTRTPFNFRFDVAVKTGTSSGFRDSWTLGYTREVTVGVWVGNFDGRPMGGVSGMIGAGPLFSRALRAADRRYRALAKGASRRPLGGRRKLIQRRVCTLSGQLPGPACAQTVVERFLPRRPAPRRCTVHAHARVDRRNGLLAGASCPERMIARRAVIDLPAAYDAWARARKLPLRPRSYSPLCPGSAVPHAVRITFPPAGARFLIDPARPRAAQSIPLVGAVDGPASALAWRIDGRLLKRVGPPFRTRWRLRRGRHQLVAVAPGGVRSRPVTFHVH